MPQQSKAYLAAQQFGVLDMLWHEGTDSNFRIVPVCKLPPEGTPLHNHD